MIELTEVLKSIYNLLPTKPLAHAHLTTPITGMAITDTWTKLDLTHANISIATKGGLTLDSVNKNFVWDDADTYSMALDACFIGDAGLQITTAIPSGTRHLILGLFVGDTPILETTLSFDKTSTLQSYGANDPFISSDGITQLLTQGADVNVRIKAGSGESVTVTLEYFYIIITGR